MPTIIPFDASKAAGAITVSDEFETDIDGERYRFVARWNDVSEGAWFLDIYQDDTALIFSVRVSTGVPLARWLRHPLTRKGILLAVDTSGQYIDPGRYDLGQRVIVAHFTEAEVLGAISESSQ